MDSKSSTLMAVGTPDEVKAYCKELIEVAGKDGGFILTNGCALTMPRRRMSKP
jgi:uroporphyrinogen-III decarboxylase